MASQQKPIIETSSSILGVFCKEEFEQLTEKEKNYCYYFSRACWEGAKICFFQKTFESPALFTILQLVFSAQNQTLAQLKEASLKNGITEDQYQAILVYCAKVFNDCGNYKSFGDSKFVPDVEEDVFYKFIQSSQNYASNSQLIDQLWNEVKPLIFRYDGQLEKIGFPGQGQSGYYSQNIGQLEILNVDKFLAVMDIDPLNTRVMKVGDRHFQVLIASSNYSKKTHYYQNDRIDLVYGDYAAMIKRVIKNLDKAYEYAANPIQKQMIQKYIEHFSNGDIDVHKDSQRLWVRDIDPVVETNIGFIESYLDPKQVRAEFEGFVSLVDKQKSLQTNNFVNKAENFLQMMPWPAAFEKDKFLKPNFTVLSILSFGCSGTPLGINIPNYDDIRQEEGFKNVYLINCLPKVTVKSAQFVSESDAELKFKYFEPAIFHKIIYHELLGHGCGKLLQKTENGLNFDPETIDPTTGQQVMSYYGEKDTWMSVFQNLSNPYEECRADSVALYFSCFKESVEALQPEHTNSWEELCHVQFLNFACEAVVGLQFYNVKAQKWGQAHINGRWVILQVLLEAGNNFVTVEKVKDSEGKDDVLIKVDYSQCLTTGKEAMRKFLLKLQVYKATANFESARKMYGTYSEVSDKFLEIRDIIIARKKPRRLELQGNLFRDEQGNVSYRTYEENFEGIISSYIDRYPQFDKEMYDLYQEYKNVNQPKL